MRLKIGRVIPTTPWEAPFRGIASWLGIGQGKFDEVCPNLHKFNSTYLIDVDNIFEGIGVYPTSTPTQAPSHMASVKPSPTPTLSPTLTVDPLSIAPSNAPSSLPSQEPTLSPTLLISTASPSDTPSIAPSYIPSLLPSQEPSLNPTLVISTASPSDTPSIEPSSVPSSLPSQEPSLSPTLAVSTAPSPITSPSPSISFNCNDSPLRFKIVKPDGKKITRNCKWIGAKDTQTRCSWEGVSSICPSTCGTCEICVDSISSFRVFWNRKWRFKVCKWANNKVKCETNGVSDTCRKTCGTC